MFFKHCWSRYVLWSSGIQLDSALISLADAKLDNILLISISGCLCIFWHYYKYILRFYARSWTGNDATEFYHCVAEYACSSEAVRRVPLFTFCIPRYVELKFWELILLHSYLWLLDIPDGICNYLFCAVIEKSIWVQICNADKNFELCDWTFFGVTCILLSWFASL